jgi:hypothetical protein
LKRLAVAGVALILVALAAAVVVVEVGAPLGGLTHAQATAAARDAIHYPNTAERWAMPGPFLLFRGGSTDAVSPWRRMVWAVSFTGTFAHPCGPLRHNDVAIRCPDLHTVTVVIDYETGEFIQADYGP